MMAPEIQGGWYDLWGGYGYEHVRKQLGPLAMDMTLKSCLAQGTSILSIYMACGGTTWAYTTEPEVYTSYDYGAPITEGGRISERAEACRIFSEFVTAHEKSLLNCTPVTEPGSKEKDKALFVKVRKNPAGEHFVFVRNLTGKDQRVKTSVGEFDIKYPGMDVIMLDKNGKVVDKLPTIGEVKAEPNGLHREKPALAEFNFAVYDEPLQPSVTKGWKKIGKEMDLDAIGFHYGFAWYRAWTKKPLHWLKADARQLWVVYVNGEFVQAFNNFRNMVGNGMDDSKEFRAEIPARLLKDENVVAVLVESLGHCKGFMEDSFNPRGLVTVATDAGELEWEAMPGLIAGEEGITPCVDFNAITPDKMDKVKLPHKQQLKGGLGIYLAEFDLALKAPDQPGVGAKITKCSGKANIYINGWLIGRYWDALGPQHLFYLPPDLLNISGRNQLAIVVWPWGKEIELGEVQIIEYP